MDFHRGISGRSPRCFNNTSVPVRCGKEYDFGLLHLKLVFDLELKPSTQDSISIVADLGIRTYGVLCRRKGVVSSTSILPIY